MTEKSEFVAILHAWAEVFMRRSMRDMIQFAKSSGVSIAQLNTLMYLSHHNRCGVSGIGDHLGVTNAAASQMIERLVQQGFLERSEDPQDRRSKQISLTEKGRKLIEDGIETRRRWMEDLATALGYEEQELITQALVLLTRAARKLEPIATTQEAQF